MRRKNLRELPHDAGRLVMLTLPDGICNLELRSNVDVLALRTDCSSLSPSGAAAALGRVLPYANPCASRTATEEGSPHASESTRSTPGSVNVIEGDGEFSSPAVAFMHSRWETGSSKRALAPRAEHITDDLQRRSAWLEECLQSLPSRLSRDVTSVAFPIPASVNVRARSSDSDKENGPGLAAQRAKSELAAQKSERKAYLTALRRFAERNPQLRVLAVS